MNAPEPLTWESLTKLGPVILVALLGGAVAFYRKVKEGAARAFNFTEFIGEMLTSALAGVLFYWFCQYAEMNPWLTAAIVGIAGHMGSRGMFLLEKWVESKFSSATNLKDIK